MRWSSMLLYVENCCLTKLEADFHSCLYQAALSALQNYWSHMQGIRLPTVKPFMQVRQSSLRSMKEG
jgi:hypothetical protein